MAKPRFPFPIPYGWFTVGRVDELPAEPVSSHELFGRQLVLWQDGGERHLVDATCPHLGAHLGVGGRIEDGCSNFTPSSLFRGVLNSRNSLLASASLGLPET